MPIIPLYEMPLCSDINNQELFEKYIKPHIWEGELWIDGGWGPKELIQELTVDNPVTGFKIPFLVSPINNINFDSTFKTSCKDTDQRYHIAFPGEHWQVLYNFIKAVKDFGVKEQRFILNSYFSTKIPEEGEKIYQLSIVIRQDSTTITIEKGKWIPSFDDSLIIAGW